EHLLALRGARGQLTLHLGGAGRELPFDLRSLGGELALELRGPSGIVLPGLGRASRELVNSELGRFELLLRPRELPVVRGGDLLSPAQPGLALLECSLRLG